MAAFASEMVGNGMVFGKMVDVLGTTATFHGLVETQTYGRVDPSAQITKIFKQRINITDLDNMLIDGNRAVFATSIGNTSSTGMPGTRSSSSCSPRIRSEKRSCW